MSRGMTALERLQNFLLHPIIAGLLLMIGAIGISGDGVDQDDIIGISGTRYHRPAPEIRADQFTYRGARLPYVKFPRDPER